MLCYKYILIVILISNSKLYICHYPASKVSLLCQRSMLYTIISSIFAKFKFPWQLGSTIMLKYSLRRRAIQNLFASTLTYTFICLKPRLSRVNRQTQATTKNKCKIANNIPQHPIFSFLLHQQELVNIPNLLRHHLTLSTLYIIF